MAQNQWDKIGKLFEEAREVPPDERAAYLEEACEEAVREEVLSLLEAEEEAGGFFDGLASALPSVLGEEEPDPEVADPLELEGKDVGRYAVEEHLGGGGMGVVYRARLKFASCLFPHVGG